MTHAPWSVFACLLAVLTLLAPARAQVEDFLHPPAQDKTLETPRAGHPRVLVTAAGWGLAAKVIEEQPTAAAWHAGARRAVPRRDGRSLAVEITAPGDAGFTVMDAAPLPTSPNPSMQNANKGVRKLAISLTVDRPTTIRVELSPLPDEDAKK